MKSLLVLTVLLLGYLLVGVASVSAPVTTLNIAVARGTNNGVYAASYNSPGVWSSWQSLGGSTPSPPGICDAEGFGVVYLVVRGMDNGIYVNGWTGGSGWSGSWVSPPGGGRTIDAPACAYLDGFLHVVVRGMNNELYWNSWAGLWTGWVDLHGKSSSAPVLVSTPSLDRIDLFVQGMDNGIYHKTYTGSPPSGTWSSWNSPGGKTLSKPAAAFLTEIYGCSSSCFEIDAFALVVRGTDNGVYGIGLNLASGWSGWDSLKGKTESAPTLAYFANGCTPGTTVGCYSAVALAVRGTDNTVYYSEFAGSWVWDSLGGSIANSPALAYVPGMLPNRFLLLVEGPSPFHSLFSNTVTAAYPSTWGTWMWIGGATNSDPALVAVL